MKAAVLGAGGVGSVFGGRLAAAGHEVWLIHRRPEMVDALRRDGLILETGAAEERIPVAATTRAENVGAVDLVLVLTKSQDTRAAAESARALVGDATCVLTLQNGLGNLETLAEVFGEARVLMGMTYVGATLLGPGRARHTAVGASFVGEPNGAASLRARELAALLTDAGMPTQATDRLWSEVWGKLLINAALNATCALTGASGSDVLASEPARHWIGLVADETARVAAAQGIELPYPDPGARVLRHCQDIQTAKPSMLQDIERGRPTEVDAINGAIVRLGQRIGVPTPLNEALFLLVKAREDVLRRASV